MKFFEGYNKKEKTQTSKNNSNSFTSKVIFGIGIVVLIAAISTISIISFSKSSQINFFTENKNINSLNPLQTTFEPKKAEGQSSNNDSSNIDKKFVLIQHNFGWNGSNLGPPIIVSKGDKVQITVINAGEMAHNFGIAKFSDKANSLLTKLLETPRQDRLYKVPYNMISETPFPDSKPIFKEGHIESFMHPQTQKVITFTANEKGHFKYFCMVRGHLWLGMVGDLIVL